jgi:hypothetical protein
MSAEPIRVAVELSGGPLDGHQDAVEMPPGRDVWLFRVDTRDGWRTAHAYEMTGRSTGRGRSWVLAHRCEVSRQKLEKTS